MLFLKTMRCFVITITMIIFIEAIKMQAFARSACLDAKHLSITWRGCYMTVEI